MQTHGTMFNRIFALGLLAALAFALVTAPAHDEVRAAVPTSGLSTQTQGNNSVVLRVYFSDHAERDKFATELGAEESSTRSGYLTVWTDYLTYQSLLSRPNGPRVEIDHKATREVQEFQSSPRTPDTFYGGYRTVEEMEAFLDAKAAAYPGLAEKLDIGDSWCKTHPGACIQPAPGFNGYDLVVLHITNRSIPGPKGVMWIDGGIHTREIATPELAMHYISWLLDGYASNADARYLVDYRDIYIMPMLNPDGHHITETPGEATPYSHRKNADRDDGCSLWPPTPNNSFGVDINRNYPYQWGCCGGSSSVACDQTYRGPAENSEEETQAVVNKVRALIPDQRPDDLTSAAPLTTTGNLINIHSNAQQNLFPWGFTAAHAPNRPDLKNIGEHMSSPDVGGNGYDACQNLECLYVVDGDEKNWAYGELGISAYSLEVSGSGFFPTITYTRDIIWPENRNALIYMTKIAQAPYLLNRGPDANLVAANPMTVTQGTPSHLTGSIDSYWTDNTGGFYTNLYAQNIAAAHYSIDTPPERGGTLVPMTPVDGNFDTNTEAAEADIDTSALSVGRHVIFVRGRGVNDYGGFQSWGPTSAVFLDVLPAGPTPTGTPPTATSTRTPLSTSTPTSPPVTVTSTGTPAGSTVTPTPCTLIFSDVNPSDFFYVSVQYLACHGVISGYSDGTFRPYNNTTRGQLTKIVVLAEGWTLECPTTPTFTDVPTTHTFFCYVETAVSHAIISGYADGTFKPENNVTRGQLSKIVVEARGYLEKCPGPGQFSDVPTTHTFFCYIETAYNHGIISGYADGTFRPGNNATRGQISKIVYEAITGP